MTEIFELIQSRKWTIEGRPASNGPFKFVQQVVFNSVSENKKKLKLREREKKRERKREREREREKEKEKRERERKRERDGERERERERKRDKLLQTCLRQKFLIVQTEAASERNVFRRNVFRIDVT